MHYLTWPDYLILVAFLVISLGIGVYHSLTGGRQKTTSEFTMANRALKVLPTSVSLLVSFQSAIMILGTTAEMYSHGSQFLLMTSIAYCLSIFLAVQIAVPWLYRLKLVSINEYIEVRYKSKALRAFASAISIFSGVLYMGTAMYAPSAALESATGLPTKISIPVMAVVATAYTSLGGMRAVIWTDVFQSVVMIGGMLAIAIKGLIVVGGVGNVISLCSQEGRLKWTDLNPDPTTRHTVWGFLFGYTFSWFKIYGLSQASVQRYCAVDRKTKAKLILILNLPALLLINVMACFTGLIVVSYYSSIRCDPLANKDIANTNQLLAHFVLQMFADSPGFAGLFLATLYGGALSSVSSSLSGAAANCWEDVLKVRLSQMLESRRALLNRFLVIFFGLSATGLAFVAASVPGPITQIAMTLGGTVQGPLGGLFILGGITKYANWKGAFIGAGLSMACSIWISTGSFLMKTKHPTVPPLSIDGCTDFGGNLTDSYSFWNNGSAYLYSTTEFTSATTATTQETVHGLQRLYSISYIWYNLLWMFVTVAIGFFASLAFRDKALEEDVKPQLLFDFGEIFVFDKDYRKTAKSLMNSEVVMPLKEKSNGKQDVGESGGHC